MTTGEGDNILLTQQTCKFLLKAKSEANSNMGNFVPYLNSNSVKSSAKENQSMLDPKIQLELFGHKANRLLTVLYDNFRSLGSQHPMEVAWNELTPLMVEVSEAHAQFTCVHAFISAVSEIQDSPLRAQLKQLCDLFVLNLVDTHKGDFLVDGFITEKEVTWTRSLISSLLPQVRNYCVPLVDALDFSDQYLNSALGIKSGDVYRTIMEWQKEDPLNLHQVTPAYQKHISKLTKPKL